MVDMSIVFLILKESNQWRSFMEINESDKQLLGAEPQTNPICGHGHGAMAMESSPNQNLENIQ
jgi:hypothetical protein